MKINTDKTNVMAIGDQRANIKVDNINTASHNR